MEAREGCELCGWHSPWRPLPEHELLLAVDVMDHMAKYHREVYLHAWPDPETREAHRRGWLRKVAEQSP